jgi:hypothetical protein
MVFKLMRACIGILDIKDIWFNEDVMKIPGLLAVSDNNGEEQGKISGKNNESK